METIGDKIKNKLKDDGFKIEYVANKLGITHSALSQRLDNGDLIKYKTLLEISNVTNIPVVDFVTYPYKYFQKYDCDKCKEKDEIIRNLNEYINLLKNK